MYTCTHVLFTCTHVLYTCTHVLYTGAVHWCCTYTSVVRTLSCTGQYTFCGFCSYYIFSLHFALCEDMCQVAAFVFLICAQQLLHVYISTSPMYTCCAHVPMLCTDMYTCCAQVCT
eukprot:GHVS01052630.1.p2 GENE.GHVS01052630.1~~GHVS01052630.1.p2  ORF type:complete len:116 (-),score=7.38 GHVS01052630.1:113-460(-)